MLFKEEKLKGQLEGCAKLLQEICAEFDRLSQDEFGIEAVVTRVTDPVKGESGVHPDKRAADFRNEHGGKKLYTPGQSRWLVNEINRRFPRDDGRMTCILHSFQGGPEHFHIQVKKGS